MAFQDISKSKIIGGMFGLPESVVPKESTDTSQWLFLKESNLFLANARSGIKVLIDLLEPGNVWMPSYLCPAMLDAVDQKKTTLRFYEVDYDLRIPSIDWVEKIQHNDIVVLVDFFGFPLDANISRLAKEQGAWVLEDACQALLSEHVGLHSDFVVFSPRKFIGVADGGVVASTCDVTLGGIELNLPPARWWLKALEAAIGRREFDHLSGGRRWYDLFQETEQAAPCAEYAMSDLSRNLLHMGFDYSEIAERRRDNYALLAEELSALALMPVLPKGVVPLGFPLIHPQRNYLRESLFRQGVYPPIHWPIRGLVPNEFIASHSLSEQIMTLPCDQRYSEGDMKRMARFIDNARQEIPECATA